MLALQVRLLGQFCLCQGDTTLAGVNTSRLRSLLAFLIMHCESPQSRHYTAFCLWPDSSESQAQTNLRQLLYHLRRAWPEVGDFLQIDTRNLQWRANSNYRLDVSEFEHHLTRAADAARDGRSNAERAALECAIEQYRGEFLPGCYDEWIFPVRERLSQAYLGALERLLLLAEAQRNYRTAIGYAVRLLRHDPLHETTYRRLMRLHALNGDRASALRIYHTCATYLERELGVAPNPDTQAAYQRLLKMETPQVLRIKPPSLAAAQPVLVGRQDEWSLLRSVWHSVEVGRVAMVAISGEAGTGKSRLAEAFLEWAEQQGIATAKTQTYAAEGQLAYAPVIELLRCDSLHNRLSRLDDVWLTELLRLMPELVGERPNLPRPEPISASWQRQRLFEALARAIFSDQEPGLLLFDDLQWCDRDTLEWIHYLLHFDPKARLLIVGTVRPEEVDQNHPLTPLLQDLHVRDLGSEIELGPLDESDTAALAEQLAGRKLDADQIARLYRDTEGNPLFVVETMRTELSWGEGEWKGGGDSFASSEALSSPAALPPRVQAIIQRRLFQLSPAAQELAGLAAVIGRSFTFQMLMQASGWTEDVLVRGLDELWRRRVVREQAGDTYNFTHCLIREVAYSEASPIQRRHWHKCVAESLALLFPDEIDALCGEIGLHYTEAQQWRAALDYYRRAVHVSTRVGAVDLALFYANKVVMLLDRLPTTLEHVSWRIDGWLAMARAMIGTHGWTAKERKELLELAYQAATESNDERRQFQALWGLRSYASNSGDWHTAHRLSLEIVARAKQLQDDDLLLTAYHLMGNAALHRGELAAALECNSQVFALENSTGNDRFEVNSARSRRAEILWICGHPEQAKQAAMTAIQMADQQADPHSRIHVREFIMYSAQRAGDTAAMQQLATQIIELCTKFRYFDYALCAQLLLGWQMAETGAAEEGLREMEEALKKAADRGVHVHWPYFLALLAEAQCKSGRLDRALLTLEEALQVAETSGELHWKAELLRLTGEFQSRAGFPDGHVEQWYQAARAIAIQQQAKSLELRATLSLARLWQTQGKGAEAYVCLSGIYNWFSEGFETADLQAARTLLATLRTK